MAGLLARGSVVTHPVASLCIQETSRLEGERMVEAMNLVEEGSGTEWEEPSEAAPLMLTKAQPQGLERLDKTKVRNEFKS